MTTTLPILFGLTAAALDDPVQSGRKALDRWNGYPWYDGARDAVKAIPVTPPPPATPSGRSSPAALSALGWSVIGLLALLAVVLAVRVARNCQLWRTGRGGDQRAPEPPPPQIEALPFSVPQPRGDLLEAAREAAAREDFAAAVLYLFSHQLIQLDRRRLIELERGKTNRQYLRELGARSGLRRVVEQTMIAFEDVFFGRHSIDRQRMAWCWEHHARFEQQLQAETAA